MRKNARMAMAAAASAFVAVAMLKAGEGGILNHPGNMRELKCRPPSAEIRLVESNAPGQLFFLDEKVAIKIALRRGDMKGEIAFSLEMQEIGTRTPGKNYEGMEGFTDTAGHAPIVDLIGQPSQHEFKVKFGDAEEEIVAIADLPLPKRFGTFAVILTRGEFRQFLCTLARVPQPRPDGTVENVPIFGEGQFLNGDLRYKAAIYQRMGIRGWRSELSWSEEETEEEKKAGKVDPQAVGNYRWERYDALCEAAKSAGCKIMVTLGAHPSWSWPFRVHQTPGAVLGRENWDFKPYWGQCDWLCPPSLYPRYGKWIKAFCQRYWEEGRGALWGLENFNEPWEGGGISGYARDCVTYRELQKVIANAAREVSTDIRILGTSSIMNTEDKLYSDGSKEFDKYIDIFTDHYVPPPGCYGPMVARAHGKQSMETETWFVAREYELPQVAQFLASGQMRLSPWHPRVLFENLPGGGERALCPTPLVVATAAFNRMVTGRSFKRILFHTHLPWVFQFGEDDDKDALLVVFGRLIQIGGNNPKETLWPQVNDDNGGEMTIDNADGLLKFYDLAGNPCYEGEKQVRLPMSIFPSYIVGEKGPKAAAARLAQMEIRGKRPVEILPRDFTCRLGQGALLEVALHNCLNRSLKGRLAIQPPPEIVFAETKAAVELAAGETKTIAFAIKEAKANDENAYAFAFTFTSEAGNAEYREVLHAAVAIKRQMKVDGDLSDWQGIPAVAAFASKETIDLTELMRRPWLQVQAEKEELVAGRVRLAWDEEHLYVAAEVKDKTPEPYGFRFSARNEDSYFHIKEDDDLQPFKRFLETIKIGDKTLKEAGYSFAEVPFVYRRSPEAGIPFRRDRLQIALDVSDDWHDLQPTTDKVPYGFHVVPDTDYEYSLYWCDDGKAEIWRYLAPGVPRIHDFPRQPRGKPTTGAVENGQIVVIRTENGYIYEAAIPKSELHALKFTVGTQFGFTFKIGNSNGAQPEYGHDKAVCKINGLTLHPYWEKSPSASTRWIMVE